MRNFLLGWTLFTILAAVPVHAGDRVVARVNGEPITFAEVTAALAQNPDLDRQTVMDLLIERRLVLVWATSNNISIADEELEKVEASIRQRNNLSPDQFEEALAARGEPIEVFRANLREQLMINQALGRALSDQTRVSESELQELYKKMYARDTIFEVSHILFRVEEDATPEEDRAVREKAEQVMAEITGGASFENMVSRYSQDESSAGNGGRLGVFKEGELIPELEDLAQTLEPGEVGGPVRTSAGYHLILLESRRKSEPPPFVEVRSMLEKQLMAQKEESARVRWLKELKETAYIEIFPDDG